MPMRDSGYPQEQQQRPSDVIYEQMPPAPVSDEVWKIILDRSKAAEQLISMLRGEVIVPGVDKDGKPTWTIEVKGEPLMNEKGIKFFTPLIYSMTSPDKISTFLTEEEVSRLMREMVATLVNVIWERGDEFEIPASNRSYVLRLIEQNYFMALTASREGTILNLIKTGVERREYYTPMKPQSGFKWPRFLGGD